uniref:helix-turn-helix domain-containing protein n=1 Tax=Microscilla sp. PRE1 TaxID=155537 RepID=UPI001E5C652D|nr:helix-turn-helix domain-containing protein [Microscilla sp. PRE1]
MHNPLFEKDGYSGSNYACHFGEAVPVIPIQTVPLFKKSRRFETVLTVGYSRISVLYSAQKRADMSKNLDPMDLKQIIALHLDGLSNRKIGETLSISRNTVNRYLQLFEASEYTIENSMMPG